MALDPNRWTIKTQEAFTQATEAARANSNPEVTPDHLLAALLRQEEGVVLPILNRVGTQPLSARNAKPFSPPVIRMVWNRSLRPVSSLWT